MDESVLEIREYQGNGYQPLVDFGKWRVAMLRYLDDMQPDRIDSMERHLETDEVFVLLHGRGILLMGGNAARVNGILSQEIENGKVYNVKRSAWHTVLLSRDATVLLVENRDTTKHNSEYIHLSMEHRRSILELARRSSFE
jgi:mannose-6-phosphate isomerase-like protein (cupin superfamily)